MRVALRRAAHQVVDRPIVFEDPFAIRILGEAANEMRAPQRPYSHALRAFLVARSRYAEETLARAVAQGATQYILLGAGLDTFSLRNPYPGVHVFEVDHPATQQWKLGLLADQQIALPSRTTYVPVDFEHQQLRQQLDAAGYDPTQPTVFAWLGVVPYLTEEGFASTLSFISNAATGSAVIFDYGLPRASLPFFEQLAHDSLAARVAAAGEPFQLFFTPEEISERLIAQGFCHIEDLDSHQINRRYFANRTDDLRVLGSAGHLLSAWVGKPLLSS
jgi:methyltransferase (TIGR00027 family)